jgi:hypothetical protein
LRVLARFAVVALLALPDCHRAHAETVRAPADPRLVRSADSPGWLSAVGKLTVSGQRLDNGRRRNHIQDCSATLVSAHPGRDADTIVSAWHCFEDYRDLTRPITFTLHPGPGATLSRQARLLASGGSMHGDWAILRLAAPVRHAEAQALPVHPRRASAGQPIFMAGYSRDATLGAGGRFLTYHPRCRIIEQSSADTRSDCLAFRGASGGAVVQLGDAGQTWLSGVISSGNGGDTSVFVPVARFRSTLNQFLVN